MNVAIILKEIIGRGICKSRNKLNLIYKIDNLFLADVISTYFAESACTDSA